MRNSLIGFFLALVATSLLASAGPAPAKDIADVQIVATAMNVAERALNLADQVAQAAPTADEVELAVWNSVKDTTFPAELGAYLAIYPNGIFAPLARIRLEAMLGATPEAQAAREREAQAAVDDPHADAFQNISSAVPAMDIADFQQAHDGATLPALCAPAPFSTRRGPAPTPVCPR
jgi:hypothetical protein